MSTLVLCNGVLCVLTNITMSCANDLMIAKALKLDDTNGETFDAFSLGMKRPTFIDLCEHIEKSDKPVWNDWSVINNGLAEHGYLDMDKYIALKGSDHGIRIIMTYSMQDDTIRFTATSNDAAKGDGSNYTLNDLDKKLTYSAIKTFSTELKNLCDSSDITIEFEEVKFE